MPAEESHTKIRTIACLDRTRLRPLNPPIALSSPDHPQGYSVNVNPSRAKTLFSCAA
jgi:hypothetical protein